MKKCLVIFFLCFLTFIQTTANDSFRKKEHKPTNLLSFQNPDSKDNIFRVNKIKNELNKVLERVAYKSFWAKKKNHRASEKLDEYCTQIKSLLFQIEDSSAPISLGSVRESARISEFLFSVCNINEAKLKDNSNHKKFNLLYEKQNIEQALKYLPHSADLIVYSTEQKLRDKKITPNEAVRIYLQSFSKDSENLNIYRLFLNSTPNHNSGKKIQKEYCQKAVELKQWDHIHYLTDYMQIMPCALGESDKWWDFDNDRQIKCKCKEAMQLVVKHWPDEYIENAIYEHLNPHAERPVDEKVYAQEIKDYRKELFKVAKDY